MDQAIYVLNQLRKNNSVFAKHISNFSLVIEVSQTKVGVFDHSLGGACLDGKMSGPVIKKGLDRPFLLMGAKGNTRANVYGWSDFLAHLHSFRCHIVIKGTTHGSFEDISLVGETYASVRPDGTAPPNLINDLETIKGSRIIEIIKVYVNSLFDKCFKGDSGALLDVLNLQYPEVLFEN